ncbi:MAG: CNT family concentrative nucleoside transporter [Candidatus Azotimanducaceae bacterium]|jgi:CNT family concentrative nucleoside transporter
MNEFLGLLHPLFGLCGLILLAFILSEQRSRPSWKLIALGLGLQFVIALIMFKIPAVQDVLASLNQGVVALANASDAGSQFVFGYLGGSPDNVAYPFSIDDPGATYIVAFRVLPMILFFTVLSGILWYLRVLPFVIGLFSKFFSKTLGLSGAVGISTAGSIFLGMVEAPLLVRPFLVHLTRSELFIVMTCGMATVAGAVMILYSLILQDVLVNAFGHILTASVISVPAAVMMARIIVPGGESQGGDEIHDPMGYQGLMDTITKTTTDGVGLMVNVGAMLIVFSALVALANAILSSLPLLGGEVITLQAMFGLIFAPVAWLMGIPWNEAVTAGALMGSKTVLNELYAFLLMSDVPTTSLSDHSKLILTYAMCGFANFGSLGIMIAGLSGMCPSRRSDIIELAPKALIAGTLATCLTGTIAGILTL